MSKTIETTLRVDDRQHNAAYQKAAQVVEKYESQVTASQQRARSLAADNLRVLALEASGHSASAAALREQIAQREQARNLARETGLTEAAALATVQARAEYERVIAERKEAALQSAAKQVAFEKSLADAARGRAAEMAAMTRASERLRTEAAANAEKAAKQAKADAQARVIRIQNAPLPELPLSPQYLQQLDKANLLKKEMARQSQAVGFAAKNGGLGILAFSQAVEDAQYGIRGVLNNIPGMVMGFGGSAGLAGAISLAAVGLVTYDRLLKQFSGDDALERKLAAETKAWGEYMRVVDSVIERSAKLKLSNAVEAGNAERLQKEQNALERLVDIEEHRFRKLEQIRDLQEAERDRAARTLDARERYSVQAAGPGEETAVRRRAAELRALEQQAAIAEEIAGTQERLRVAGEQYQRVWDGTAEKMNQYTLEISRAQNGLQALKDQLEKDEAKAKAKRDVLPEMRPREAALAEKDLKIIQERIDATRVLVAQREALISQTSKLLEDVESRGKASKKRLDEEINGGLRKLAQLEKEQETVKFLAAAEKARFDLVIQQQKAKQAEAQAAFAFEDRLLKARAAGNAQLEKTLERQRSIEDLKKRIIEEQGLSEAAALAVAAKRVDLEQAVARAKDQAAQVAARRDFAGELKVLELQAAGMDRQAKALREEIELRGQAKAMAESMGISEREALELARKREELQRKVSERNEGPVRRRAIYKLSAEESAERQQNRNVSYRDRPNGLRANVNERTRSRVRETAVRDRAAASNYYDRSLAAQEALVRIFKNVGVI